VEKTVVKTQVVRERGKDIVRYVDREVVKFDANCVIPQEFVTVHNRAAEAPK
jgi:transcriptional regulator of nitric oxide reductase